MQAYVSDWLARRTYPARWRADALVAARGDTTVSVVLPALDEQDTVGDIVTAIRADLVEAVPLVDEVVVVDSGSTDRTGTVAAAAGARVVRADEILPHLPAAAGKGEAMWRSLAATSGDVVAFVDADLRDFSTTVVTGLLGPLLTEPGVELVKALYDRPLDDGRTIHPSGGGRVTELVARPLLNLHWPALAGFVQPLAGEWAARRGLLEQVPFPRGYGVELGVLIDALRLCGLDALAQVDVGVRRHRHHDDAGLGRMAATIWLTALARMEVAAATGSPSGPSTSLVQFSRGLEGLEATCHEIESAERPPMCTVPEYAERVVPKPARGRHAWA